jgi:hypothetical protein
MPRDITALAKNLYELYKDAPIPYAYGCAGQKPTVALAKEKGKQYPTFWPAPYGKGTRKRLTYAEQFKAPWCCDCIGWIRILYLYDAKLNPLPLPKSNTNGYIFNSKNYYSIAGMDISANGLRKSYGGKSICSIPEPTADRAVFVSKEGHVGLYIGNGDVIEQTPPKLQKTKLANHGWTSWGYIPDKWRDFMEKTVGFGTLMNVSVNCNTASSTVSSANLTPPTYKTHTVVKGDTPWLIAQKLTGKGEN